jgi:hypothetical protein
VTLLPQVIRVYRTKTDMLYDTGARTLVKATFPLQLAYAMTGHKCQGATLTGMNAALPDLQPQMHSQSPHSRLISRTQ